MKKVFALFLLFALFSCNKNDLNVDLGLAPGETGYLSVDGEKVTSINYGYEADMSNIGFEKGYWHFFESRQRIGDVNLNDMAVSLRAVIDPETGEQRLFSISIKNIPGHDGIYIDGMTRNDDGSYHYRGRFVEEGEAPTYVDYTIRVNKFSFNDSYTSLQADITISSDFEVRVVYSGETPNDGMHYMMN